MRPLRRRLLKLTLLGAGLAAGFVASAGADLPPLPTITLPTVTLPTVTLPVTPPPPPVTVPVPPLPPPPPVHVPPLPPPVAPPAAPAVPRLPVGGPSGGGGSAGGSAGGSTGTTGTSSARGTSAGAPGSASAQRARRSARVYRLRLSRDWIAKRGGKRQRHTTVVFVLRNPSLVQFVIVQVSPDCRRFAKFEIAGHQGVNRVRLGPRVGRRRLQPGTYRLIARAVPGGRRVVDARLVVVRHADSDEIEAARGADTCDSRTGSAEKSSGSAAGAGSTKRPEGTASSAGTKSKPARHGGVLGTKFARNAAHAAGRAVEAAGRVPLWLYALLVVAIVLLAAASLPLRAAPGNRSASALARHRGTLALAGAATLVCVMLAYLLL